MAINDSRGEYERRMHRVLEHIDRHLDADLDLNALAAVACFSPYHFHRLFAAWLGETLGEYLRRRRLEVAAMRLKAQPRLSVLQAALAVGFGSAEAFSRAFRDRFGCSPTEWRKRQTARREKNSNPDQVDGNFDQAAGGEFFDHGIPIHAHRETSMNVKLIDRPAVSVAYFRYVGPYGPGISDFWQQTAYPWLAANGLLDRPRYGISYDDPSITAPERCRYDACVEVVPDFLVSGGALKTTIPGGKHAMLSFAGTVAQIGPAWTALLRDWLPASGLQLDARPCFEHYPVGSGYDCDTGIFSCEICIPVAPL